VPDALVGQKAPAFEIETDCGRLSLGDLLREGKRLVLAFYYEDLTPTCTTQVASLKDAFESFQELGANVLALSSDSLESHARFRDRLGGLPFPLGSDPDLVVAHAYGVVDDGGRRALRAVFVIDPDGTVALALRHYSPANIAQLEQVFRTLGVA
jgi:peroxiredoxin Q/BCP